MVPLTSIVYLWKSMEVNSRAYLLWKSMGPETVWLLIFFKISENRLNGFENGKTQLFNSDGVVKLAYFQNKSGASI